MFYLKLQRDEKLYCFECGRELTSPDNARIIDNPAYDEINILCGSCYRKRINEPICDWSQA